MHSLPTVSLSQREQLDFFGRESGPQDRAAAIRRNPIPVLRPEEEEQRVDELASAVLRAAHVLRWIDQLPLELPTLPLNHDHWSDEGVSILRTRLLMVSLSLLVHEGASAEEQRDVLEWVSEPLVALSRAAPFSFQACCIAAAADPRSLRDLLLSRVARGRIARPVRHVRRRVRSLQEALEFIDERCPWVYRALRDLPNPKAFALRFIRNRFRMQ